MTINLPGKHNGTINAAMFQTKADKEDMSFRRMHWTALALFVVLAVSVFSIAHSTAVAEEEQKIYQISTEEENTKEIRHFKIPYKITNGEVKDMMGDPIIGMLLIHVETDPLNNGTAELTVPRNLIESQVNVDGRLIDVDLLVSVNNESVKSEEINSSPCFRTISFNLPAGSQQIFVSGLTALGIEEDEEDSEENGFPAIYISTDKDNYKQGEMITVSGCTSLDLDDKNLILEIINPEGQVFRTDFITPNSDGSFLTRITVEGELGIDGTYTARATYAGESESSTFVVPEFPLAALLAFAVGISVITFFARTKAVKL